MSLGRIHYIVDEIKKLEPVIKNIIHNYNNNYKEYDLKYVDVKDDFDKQEEIAQETKDSELLQNIYENKKKYTEPLNNLKSFAQFQNELMLVKHMALIENMIIGIFKSIINITGHQEYHFKYFEKENYFSDIFEAVNKIKEITKNEINIKDIKIWFLYETMKTIRNTIAHGEPLFTISYKRATKFNNSINIISLYCEINEGSLKNMYPCLPNPTFKHKSKWFCHLADNIDNLLVLNQNCLEFVLEIKELYLEYGKKNNISKHTLYSPKVF